MRKTARLETLLPREAFARKGVMENISETGRNDQRTACGIADPSTRTRSRFRAQTRLEIKIRREGDALSAATAERSRVSN